MPDLLHVIEPLESRRLLATFLVTSGIDAGPGSLRAAIDMANASPGGDRIEFAAGLTTVSLSSPLDITGDLTLAGPDAAALSIVGNGGSRLMMVAADDAVTLQLSNLRLAGGRAIGTGSSGGAVLLDGDHYLVATGVYFEDNHADGNGGAIASLGGTLVLTDCRFTSNEAIHQGGGGFADRSATIARTSFDANKADGGGGFAFSPAAQDDNFLLVTDSAFSGNDAGANSGGLLSNGGGHLARCTFSGNAAGLGGGLSIAGAQTATKVATIQDCAFIGNTAVSAGGGVHLVQLDLVSINGSRFTANTVTGNNSQSGGGGVHAYLVSSLHITESEITGNAVLAPTTNTSSAYAAGGGLFAQNGRLVLVNTTVALNDARHGGGLFLTTSDPIQHTLAHVTLSQNTAAYRGGGAVLFAGNSSPQTFSLANTVLSGNLDPTSTGDQSTSDLFHQDGIAAGVILLGRNVIGPGLAVHPDNGQHLITRSPGLLPLGFYNGGRRTMPPRLPSPVRPAGASFNTADPSYSVDPGPGGVFFDADDLPLRFDTTGNVPRTLYDAPDIGAAEAVLAGDANFDGKVDLSDFVILRNHFGRQNTLFAGGDFNGDGRVDLADFVILRNNFGNTLGLED